MEARLMPRRAGRPSPTRTILQTLIAGVLLLAATGCSGLAYSLTIITGELRILASAVPIEHALANDATLTEEQREKLHLVVAAREYGRNVVGLDIGESYTRFVNLHGQPLAYNLSGSRKDRFEPYYWYLPIVGPLPYIGFFTYDEAIAERAKMLEQGYDTLIYEVDAYSTLGLLPDPVSSALLERNIPSLADTVLHELMHNTVSHISDTTFNESVATFVGRTAGLEFLGYYFGEDAPMLRAAREYYEDSDRFNTFLQETRARLETVYASNASYEEKLALREAIFAAERERFGAEVLPLMHNPADYEAYTTLPINNAFLLAHTRYNTGQDVFAAIYDLTGRDWSQTLALFSEAAATDNPMGYLQGVLDAAP